MTTRYAALCAEIVIDSTNNTIIFSEGAGPNLVATIAEGTYYFCATTGFTDSIMSVITDALTAASAADATNNFVFTSSIGGVPNGSTYSIILDQWAYTYIYATPYPTPINNIIFRWSDVANTFDPAQIGADAGGADVAWIDDGSGIRTRFISSHCPISVFIPSECLADDDDATASADVVSHKSPTNARSHFVISEIEERKTLSWGSVEHDRVHRKTDGLAFVGEEWGCLATWWAQRTYRGGRIRLFAWESDSGGITYFNTSDNEGDFVFVDLPDKLPASRASQALKIYDVGPLVLAPYVS